MMAPAHWEPGLVCWVRGVLACWRVQQIARATMADEHARARHQSFADSRPLALRQPQRMAHAAFENRYVSVGFVFT